MDKRIFGSSKNDTGKKPVSSPYFMSSWHNKPVSGLGYLALLFLIITILLGFLIGLENYLIEKKTLTKLADLIMPIYESCCNAIILCFLIAVFLFIIWKISSIMVPHLHTLESDFVYACYFKGLINNETLKNSFKFKVIRNIRLREAKIYFLIKSAAITENDIIKGLNSSKNGFTRCSFISVAQNTNKLLRNYQYVLVLGFGKKYKPYGDDDNEQ